MRTSVPAARLPARILILAAALLLASCAGHIGYGVVNWSIPERGLVAGDIVPVFIQSNIGKVYVVGIGKGGKTRVEIPLWQLTLHKSRSKARAHAASIAEYRYLYATVKLDGLPIRAAPENTAKQVYRLRAGQTIKIVRKGEGAPVVARDSPLEGEWYEVMADDGSIGWCFSYNLTIFDEREAGTAVVAAETGGPDPVLEAILSHPWYPDYYRTMRDAGRVDLARVSSSWGFFPGKDAGVARIEKPEGVETFPYSSVTKVGEGAYRFEGSTLTAQLKGDALTVQYTDRNGMPHAYYFAALEVSPDEIVAEERDRRAAVFAAIRKAGPRFSSGNYGVLQFVGDNRFIWSGYQLLSPSIIPSGAGGGGKVEARLFIGEGAAPGYQGTISFQFESAPVWVHFLYALSPEGIKLEAVADANVKDSTVVARNMNPTILFFSADGR